MTQKPAIETLQGFAKSHGASDAFVKYLGVDIDGRHLGRNKMERALQDGRKPGPFGGFMSSLWNGNTEKAWMYADKNNSTLMEKAGIKP